MLGFFADPGVVDEQNAASEFDHEVGAGIDHGLGILRAVFIAIQEAVEGIDHDQGWQFTDATDGFDHPPVAFRGVKIRAALGEPQGCPVDIVRLLPRSDTGTQPVVTFTGQIDHGSGLDLVSVPFWLAGRDVQAPVEDGKGLATAGRSVNHDEGLFLQPVLDQPFDRGWLGAEVIRRDQPVGMGWGQQQPQIVPGLDIVVGIAFDRRDDDPGPVFGRSLIGILLPGARSIVVSDNDDLLPGAVALTQRSHHGNKIRRRVGHNAGAIGCLMDRRCRGEALCHIEDAGFIHGPDHPVAATCLTATVIKFAAVCVDVLERSQVTVRVEQRNDQTSVSGDPRAVLADALLGEIGMVRAGRLCWHPDRLDRVRGNLALTLNRRIPCGLCFRHSPRLSHLLCGREFPAYVGPPRSIEAFAPATESTGRDTVRIGDIPAALIMTRLALGARAETVQLTVQHNFSRRRQPSLLHGDPQLQFRRIRLLG